MTSAQVWDGNDDMLQKEKKYLGMQPTRRQMLFNGSAAEFTEGGGSLPRE